MENDVHFGHYLEVIKRRKFHFIIPTVVVLVTSIVIALTLPSVYKATAKISIDAPEVSEDLVRTSSPAGYIEERLAAITERVLSSKNLLDIVERFALYADMKDENTTQKFVEMVKENIEMERVTTEVQPEKMQKTISLTTSFKISFLGKEPDKLADVANHLAALFLNENARARDEKAKTTIQFLEMQMEHLRSEIEQTEAKLAVFKEKHISELPDLLALNLKTMEQLERQIDAQQRHIDDLRNRKIYLEGQLALLEPMMYKVTADGRRLLSPKEELGLLRSQYLTLSASLSKQHPDVIKLKKKLEALESEVGSKQELNKLQHQLYNKEHQLALLQKKVSSEHPDAVKLKKEVMFLRKQVQKLSEKQTVFKLAEDENPENPAYINLQTRIAGTQMEIEAAKREHKELQEKYEDYRTRIEKTPQVEQQYLDLKRDYDNARAKYRETSNRLRAAIEAKSAEERRMSEKFNLVRPATTPIKPHKPNRVAIFLLGIMLAAGAGLGTGSIAEYMDQSVSTADELAKIAGHKVLTVIPYWETSQDITSKRRRIWALVGSTIAIAVIGVAALNFLYRH
jgi:uncharacterized protein involved in exopolysaccharide biosynthesis